MRRSVVMVSLAIAALLGAAERTWASGAGEGPGGPVRGSIVYLEGEVTLDGGPCAIGQAVETGATMRTGPASACEIVFGTGNVMRLREKTTAVFDLEPSTLGVRMPTGSLAAVFNKVKALGGSFRVTTSAAVAGVRGTAFFVQVEDESRTYVCACNGAVDVASKGARNATLASTNHDARRFTFTDGSTVVEKAGLLYHDNALMDSVAARIGATIPWGAGAYGSRDGGGYGD
jgi:ferric-dicitrate binding protein FerR (iron transport regulator)